MELDFIIDRFENDKAVLKGREASQVWPKDWLPAAAREGDSVKFSIATDAEAAQNKKRLAKDLLNEILDV